MDRTDSPQSQRHSNHRTMAPLDQVLDELEDRIADKLSRELTDSEFSYHVASCTTCPISCRFPHLPSDQKKQVTAKIQALVTATAELLCRDLGYNSSTRVGQRRKSEVIRTAQRNHAHTASPTSMKAEDSGSSESAPSVQPSSATPAQPRGQPLPTFPFSPGDAAVMADASLETWEAFLEQATLDSLLRES